jgi:hypothetical protein
MDYMKLRVSVVGLLGWTRPQSKHHRLVRNGMPDHGGFAFYTDANNIPPKNAVVSHNVLFWHPESTVDIARGSISRS